MKVELSKSAFKEFKKLPKDIQKRIIGKVDFYTKQADPLMFAEHITDSRFGNYRFRIGDYRAMFDIANKTIYILKVGHRKDIYR